jgi:tetraacyldisaccharide 4'-kinase
VIALGEMLKARGIRFDVLSRGYGRKTRGVLVVETDGNAADFGDEPLLIARRLGVPVIVGESRYEAGRVAEQKFQPQLHILDDGFQHRSLARDFDIVLMTERDFDDRLLPSGRLREPLSSLRAPMQSCCPASLAVDHPALRQKLIWRIERQLVLPNAFRARCLLRHRAPRAVLCPGTRRRNHAAAEVAFATTMLRPGRHQALLGARQTSAGGFLTTEKDAINLGPEQHASNRSPSPSSGSRSTVPLTLWMPFWQESGNGSPAREKILSCTRWTRIWTRISRSSILMTKHIKENGRLRKRSSNPFPSSR